MSQSSRNSFSVRTTGLTLCIGYSGVLAYKSLQLWLVRRSLRERAQAKRKARDDARAATRRMLESHPQLPKHPHNRASILSLSAVSLAQGIKDKKFSCVQVMVTHCLRALDLGETHMSNAEEFFEMAVESAVAADARLKKVGASQVGRFHGVPISVKDNMDLPGLDSTCGTACRVFKPRSSMSYVIRALVDEGAIPFVKSNLPQSLMIPETTNSIWGTALNPWKSTRTPGGSSGGEAVLVAGFASPLGIGTDIGGSIRIPCSFTGICGFKATPERVTARGNTAPRQGDASGQCNIISVCGPMARTVEDLAAVMQVWWPTNSDASTFHSDPFIPPMPFDEQIYRSPRQHAQRIGYIISDGWFEPSAVCKRALNMARQRLESLGYELVPFVVPDAREYVSIYTGVLTSDGSMRATLGGLEGESLLPGYNEVLWITSLPKSMRLLIAKLLTAVGEGRKAHLLRSAGHRDALQYWAMLVRLQNYRRRFVDQMRDQDIKVLIAPAGAIPAYPHGTSTKLLMCMSLFFMFNLMHMPAGCVPCTLVREDECHYEDDGGVNDSWSKGTRECMVGAEGLPVGVQVAAMPFRDELCLGVMRELEQALSFEHVAPNAPDAAIVK